MMLNYKVFKYSDNIPLCLSRGLVSGSSNLKSSVVPDLIKKINTKITVHVLLTIQIQKCEITEWG